MVFERYSDSAASYITLDSNNPSVYKQLYRAAKAKLKLRIKATISDATVIPEASQPESITPVRLPPHRYVPPMNPDPLKISSIITVDTSPNEAPPNVPTNISIPSIQATGNMQRQAYAQFVRDSMSSYVKGLNKENVIVNPLKPAVESEFESPVAVKQEMDEEAPVPRSFSDREHFYAELASMSKSRPTALRGVDQSFHVPGASFTVCCNSCDSTIPDAHWHCSICDDGDYDLCRDCVTTGVHCGVEGHFLIKRSIENGKVISSTTETIAPTKALKIETEKEVPGAFTSDVKEEQLSDMLEMSRTCNSCVNGKFLMLVIILRAVLTIIVFEESNFVTCAVCEDYDLCIPCHVGLKHGHHPSHSFRPVSGDSSLDAMAYLLCAPGRHMRHFAVCDGCDNVG